MSLKEKITYSKDTLEAAAFVAACITVDKINSIKDSYRRLIKPEQYFMHSEEDPLKDLDYSY